MIIDIQSFSARVTGKELNLFQEMKKKQFKKERIEMGKRGRKAKSLEVITGDNTVIKTQETIQPIETKDEFDTVLSVMSWEKIDLSKCTREEITSILMPRFGMDKDKMPSLVNALQNVLSLPERVTMATFSLSQREKMELRKQETAIALDKAIKPIVGVHADTFAALFGEFGFTSDGKAKKSFSLTNNYGHHFGKERFKISTSISIQKEDVPLTEREKFELAYQADCQAYETEVEKKRLLLVGHDYKEMQSEKAFPQGINSNVGYVVNK